MVIRWLHRPEYVGSIPTPATTFTTQCIQCVRLDTVSPHLVCLIMTGLPPPPPGANKDTKLTEDETSYILLSTLKPKHQSDPTVVEFIREFLICRDVRQASLSVGIQPRTGERLRREPDVYETIRRLTSKALEKFGYSAEDVVEKVREVTNVDMAVFQKPDGSWVESISQVPPEIRRAVKKFKVKNEYDTDANGMKYVSGRIIEVEFWDKLKAAELLGREKELFKETRKIELDATENMKDILLGGLDRANERLARYKDVTPSLPPPPVPVEVKDE